MILRHLKAGLTLCAFLGASLAQAGEIVILPSGNETATSEREATRLRESARAERKGQSPVETESVLIIPEEDAGILSPRYNSSAAENSARARAYRKENDGSAVGIIVPLVNVPDVSASSPAQSASQHARSNRERAIEYRKGERPLGSANGGNVISTDGLPVIDCQSAENVSGRIGDDTRSGNVIILIQDRQQVKVRCR